MHYHAAPRVPGAISSEASAVLVKPVPSGPKAGVPFGPGVTIGDGFSKVPT